MEHCALNKAELISVVIPVYKVEQYIERCLESVLEQTYENIEIILVDDGSPDACPQICDNYKKKDGRVIVIHQENNGLSGARNTGIRAATGRYITFIDSDDYICPQYIEQLYRIKVDSGKRIVACGYSYTINDLSKDCKKEYISLSSADSIKEVIIERTIHPSAWGKLYDKELFEQIRFPEGKIYEDYATMPLLLHLAGGMAFVDSKMYFYTFNEESITKTKFSYKQLQYFEIADKVNHFLESEYPELLNYAFSRDVNMAVSFFKKMSRDGHNNSEICAFIVMRVKKRIGYYLLSNYSIKKKAAAITIALSPKLARCLLAN